MKQLLFVCGGNDHVGQMAEGYMRRIAGDHVEAFSAGLEARGVEQRAVDVMLEDGIDISSQTSKLVDIYLGKPFDIVVVLCEVVPEQRSRIPDAPDRREVPFTNPVVGAEGEIGLLMAFRRLRNEIRSICKGLALELN